MSSPVRCVLVSKQHLISSICENMHKVSCFTVMVVAMQAEERAEKEAQRQMEKDAKNREREEAKKMARYPIEDMEVSICLLSSSLLRHLVLPC